MQCNIAMTLVKHLAGLNNHILPSNNTLTILKVTPMNDVLDIDSRSLEPLTRIDSIPQQSEEHNATINQAGVVHVQVVEIAALDCWKAEDGYDEDDPCACDDAASGTVCQRVSVLDRGNLLTAWTSGQDTMDLMCLSA